MIVKKGCVHGRFQPAHIEHLEYILKAKNKCENLVIGITQFDNSQLVECSADPHRSQSFDNPLSYEERITLIDLMLKENHVNPSTYSFSPFPIDEPDKIRDYISDNTVCFTTIRDEWNEEKINRLEKGGFIVDVLWDKRYLDKVTATDIRNLASSNDVSWSDLVTPGTFKYLSSIKFQERMINLKHSN